MTPLTRLVAATTLVLTGAALHALYAQATAPALDLSFRHIGFVVHDAERAHKDFTRILGATSSPLHTVKGMVWPAAFTGDRNTAIKTTEMRGHGLEIHLLQPIGGASPWRDHLEQHGDSLQHISFGVRDLQGTVRLLQQLGGRVTTGGADTFYAYMKFDSLPFTIELEKIQ
jgi:methylmalonyl-CoA/ethylmalonyl-CoA epimerase